MNGLKARLKVSIVEKKLFLFPKSDGQEGQIPFYKNKNPECFEKFLFFSQVCLITFSYSLTNYPFCKVSLKVFFFFLKESKNLLITLKAVLL